MKLKAGQFDDLRQQIKVLIAIPVLCQIVFICILLFSLFELQRKYDESAHWKDILLAENRIIMTAVNYAGMMGGYAATKNPHLRPPPRQGLETVISQKQSLDQLDPGAIEEIKIFDSLTNEGIELLTTMQRDFEAHEEDTKLANYFEAYKLCKKLDKALSETKVSIDQLNSTMLAKQNQGRQTVIAVIVFFVGFNLIGTFVLMRWFEKKTANRFEKLGKNIQLLGLEKPVTERLIGEDELARLDRVIHSVSRSVQESRRKEHALIDNAVDVICSIDDKGKFSQVNQASVKAWGREPSDLLGAPLKNIVVREDQDTTDEEIKKIIDSKESGAFENRIKRKDGTVSDALWTAYWSEDDKNLFCVVHDISARKNAERIKQQVVAMVSHDLRSPLTALELTLSMLKDGALGELGEKALNRVGRAERSVTQLIWLINDLLDIDKAQQGMFVLDCKEANDVDLVNESVAMVQSLADAGGVTIETRTENADVYCDNQRVVRVLTNLLSNAIKYSPRGSTVLIDTRREEGGMRFSVEDHGRGMPEDQLDLIFEAYHQVDATDDREKKGSGLGLAIVKAIVEAHKSEVFVSSAPGEGSTFWFTLADKN